jgi:4-hydroxy-tetrahydrodipicolinate synthase
MQFQGAWTALITPFTDDGASVDLERLKAAVARQAQGGVVGVVPCGTTGEAPTLGDDEHHALVQATVEAGHPLGLLVMAGTGSNDTAHAVDRHRMARRLGADASLQVTPYYNKPSQEGLYRHFMTLADSCDLPIVLYNIPSRTSVNLEIDTILRLATHPNIRAIKEASGNISQAAELARRTDLVVLSGDDPMTLPLSAVGAQGVVSVVANLLPRPVAALCNACSRGALDEARDIHEALMPLAHGLLCLDTNPVPVKTALARLGLDSGALRLPLCPPSAAVQQRIDALLGSHGMTPVAATTSAG